MTQLTPSFAVATAAGLLGLDANADERHALARRLLRGVGGPREGRWDVAFLHHIGYWSHVSPGSGHSTWPLPATARCDDLAKFATEFNVLSKAAPQAGEVFLFWSPSRRAFVRAGLIMSVEPADRRPSGKLYYECHTLEGSVTSVGGLDGDRLGRVSRFLCPAAGDRTIRWTELAKHESTVRERFTGALKEFQELRTARQDRDRILDQLRGVA